MHYEQIRFPNSFTRTRTVFNPRVADGWFRYQFGNEVREVNVLQLAAANGQISAKDPTMLRLMGLIDSATKTTGTRSANADPLYDHTSGRARRNCSSTSRRSGSTTTSATTTG